MPEPDSKTIRPTKKQRELLVFIQEFIATKGYSPSYREIMAGLNYNSVATVALHVNSLIKRGHLIKRDHTARSLEVVDDIPKELATNQIKESEAKWLVSKISHFFKLAEADSSLPQAKLDELYVLIGALKVLGLEGAAQSFYPRLTELKKRSK